MNLIEQHRKDTPVLPLCEALGLPRASLYRRVRKTSSGLPSSRSVRPPATLALSESQRQEVLDLLHSERFQDLPPTQVYPMLLDEGRYLCSVRTMYRILAQQNEVRERRPVASHPVYAKPELLATAPNQVWSWDITKLKGPVTWTYFYLYVILDIFSRYVVGWMVAQRESAALAKRLIEDTCRKQSIAQEKLTLHADRGSSMKSKLLAELLADLGVTKSHSRPSVSNDNPFSESQFKTLKYRPEFPDRFGCLQDARAFCGPFFEWYNTNHHHCGIGFYTPADVHYGRVVLLKARRQAALDAAYVRHPERFVRHRPKASCPPTAVWINPPKDKGLHVVEQPPRLLSNFQEVLSQSV
jgi:putative transposase